MCGLEQNREWEVTNMKTNKELGYEKIIEVGSYQIGRKGSAWRGYGYEWHSEQDASREFAHHEVAGRGDTPELAVGALMEAACHAGKAGDENGCSGLSVEEVRRLHDQLLEELAEWQEENSEHTK